MKIRICEEEINTFLGFFFADAELYIIEEVLLFRLK